jgi:rSAM/selenodomain-associated transferase 1
MKNKNALIIIAKYPEKGKVKTRIMVLSDDERVRIYENMLRNTVDKLCSISGSDTFIAFAPDSASEYFSQFTVKQIPLHEGDLGDRMYAAFEEVFHQGYEKVSLVGADIPDLSAAIIMQSFEILDKTDLVFGPARDGGYYLVGMSKLIREVFQHVPWSSSKTLEKSLEQARKYGYSSGFVDTLSDVDTSEDIKRLGLMK